MNMQCYEKNRVVEDKLRGGGVLLYIKNSINVILREDFSGSVFPESMCCDLEVGGIKH